MNRETDNTPTTVNFAAMESKNEMIQMNSCGFTEHL